ncbi:phosphatase PAP2 family protein [Asticcacaulis solisilvae]|uniref:phosphatase PAP2 family protein n=1 Tax=Asticcacaulis solisilvae TaxID=1217274 RepID=UPI003FD72493
MSPDLRLLLIVIILVAAVAALAAGVQAVLPPLARRSETVRLWLGRRSPGFARYTDALKNEWAFLCVMIVVMLFAAFVFFSIAEDVLEGDPSFAADKAVYALMRSLRTPAGDNGLIAVTELGDSIMVVTLGVVVAAWLAWRRTWRALLYWILAIAGGSLLNTAIKVALHRARPTDLYHSGWDAFSFPSGHSTTNAVLYGFLAVLIGRELPKRLRLPLACAAAGLVTLIAFSRLYLAAHWLSDVAGGLTFGALWVGVLAVFYAHGAARPVGARALLAICLATLVVAGGIHIALHHAADLRLYALGSES